MPAPREATGMVGSPVLQGVGVVAPALPRPALVLPDLLVLEHAAHHRRDLGLVAALALPDLPLFVRGKYRRLQYFSQLHEGVKSDKSLVLVFTESLVSYHLVLPSFRKHEHVSAIRVSGGRGFAWDGPTA